MAAGPSDDSLSMRFRPFSLLVLAVALAAAAFAARASLGERPAERRSAGGTLDSRRVDYYEAHGDSRIVAQIALALEARGAESAELLVRPSALGPFVDPPPGPRSRRGSNETTAREMARAIGEGRLAIVTRGETLDPSGGRIPCEPSSGTVVVRRSGRLPARGLAIDGALERAPMTEVLPLELELASGRLPHGRWTSEVLLDGRARLAVDYEIGAAGGAILAVRLANPRTRVESEP